MWGFVFVNTKRMRILKPHSFQELSASVLKLLRSEIKFQRNFRRWKITTDKSREKIYKSLNCKNTLTDDYSELNSSYKNEEKVQAYSIGGLHVWIIFKDLALILVTQKIGSGLNKIANYLHAFFLY